MMDIENAYWEAFWDLSSERREAGATIPWGSIVRYHDRFKIGSFDEFRRIIRIMDDTYMSELRDRQPKG